MSDLDALTWPAAQLGEAIAALGRRSGLVPRLREAPASPEGLAREGAEALGAWIEATAAWLGLEAEAVEAPYTRRSGGSYALPARPCCACPVWVSRASWRSSVGGGAG
jgi:hypothetical protein